MPPNIVSLEKTCIACPAQWVGTLSDGACCYVRYRNGILSIGFGPTPDAAAEDRRVEWELGQRPHGRPERARESRPFLLGVLSP